MAILNLKLTYSLLLMCVLSVNVTKFVFVQFHKICFVSYIARFRPKSVLKDVALPDNVINKCIK